MRGRARTLALHPHAPRPGRAARRVRARPRPDRRRRPAGRRRSPRSTPRSSGSSTSRRSAARASRTSRPTSTCSSTSRPSRSAARGTAPTSSRSARAAISRPLRVPPRLPGRSARRRLRLRALGTPPDEELAADGVRPRRDRPGVSREARAAVLVLLPLQRLQQHARGRLGDDPARLRRRRRERGADEGSEQGRLQLARGCRGRSLGRREARGRRRDASGRLSRGGLAREQVHGGALPRQLGGRRRRLRRHRRPAPRAACPS